MDGAFPDPKGHQMIPVTKGKEKDPDNQMKPLKPKDPSESTSTKAYTDKMYDQGKAPKDIQKKLNEGSALDDLTKSHAKNPLVTTEGANKPQFKFYVIDNKENKIVFGAPTVEECWDFKKSKVGTHDDRKGKVSDYSVFSTIGSKHKGLDPAKDESWDASIAENKDPENKLSGGVGDKTSAAEVDQEELALGLSIEAEHTDDPEVAKEIALDHLSEDPCYYSKLKASGLDEKMQALKESIRKIVKDKLLNELSPDTYRSAIEKSQDQGRIGKKDTFTNQGLFKDLKGKQLLGLTIDRFATLPSKDTAVILMDDINQTVVLVYSKSGDKFIKVSGDTYKAYMPDPNNMVIDRKDAVILSKIAKLANPGTKIVPQSFKIKGDSTLKEYNYVPEPAGQDVDRTNLKRLLKGVDWPPIGADSTYAYPDTGYRDRIDSEKVGNIQAIINRLGSEGVYLYNKYAPMGCQYGEEESLIDGLPPSEEEVKEGVESQQEGVDLKDLEPKDFKKEATEMDPKDLAKALSDIYIDNERAKIALVILGKVYEKGERDLSIVRTFKKLTDQLKSR
jgi:hypothetical protein